MNYIYFFSCLSLTLMFFHFTVSGQKLTAEEKRILTIIDKNHEEAVQFLEETVNINSGTYNIAGIKKVGALYQEVLDDMGFATTWCDMPAAMKRAGHLIGERKGTQGKKLLLNGHMDTVFEPDSPFQTWQVQNNVAIGPGVTDMKGGLMVMLYALKALHEANLLDDRQIIVILHGDEENAGDPITISRKDLIEAAKRSDIALCYEPATGFNDATIARRGSSSWALKVTGKQAHSSSIFTERTGAGAIYETGRILNRFYEALQEPYLTFSPGLMLGGTTVHVDSSGTLGNASGKANVVAKEAYVKGDLRFLYEEQKEKAREKMKAIVAESYPLTQADITFEEGYPSMPPTDGNMAVLNVLSQVSLDLGQGAVKPYDPGNRGAGDISFVAQYLDCLDGLGAMGGNSHAPEEYMDLTTLKDFVKRSALLIYRLTR